MGEGEKDRKGERAKGRRREGEKGGIGRGGWEKGRRKEEGEGEEGKREEVDEKGRINLSIKQADPNRFTKKEETPRPPRPEFKKRY